MDHVGVIDLQTADCRLHLKLSGTPVSLNITQVNLNSSHISLFTVFMVCSQKWKGECNITALYYAAINVMPGGEPRLFH